MNIKITALLLFVLFSAGLNGQIQVGYLTPGSTPTAIDEEKHVISSLEQFRDIRLIHFTYEEIRRKPEQIRDLDVLWIQRTDTLPFTDEEKDPRLLKTLKEFISQGGGLLLNQESFMMIQHLGLERKIPEARHKSCADEGYGRKLGYHAFRSHPVFEGLNGGAYVQRPSMDTVVRIAGFFGDVKPESGKIIGVDWDYIFLRESSKLILEYTLGTGRVIAVGGYLSFSMPNLNRQHLALFTANALRYLAGNTSSEKANYWFTGPFRIDELEPVSSELDRPFAAIPPALEWETDDEPLAFPPGPASTHSWDQAGERMVIMGAEHSGIEEIWAHPFMALRDYEVGIRYENRLEWLTGKTPEVVISPSCLIRTYTLPAGNLKEIITVSPTDPNGVVHYEFTGSTALRLVIRFRTNLRFMWPYSEEVTGCISHGWDGNYQAFTATDITRDLVLMAGANREPVAREVKGDTAGMNVSITLDYDLVSEDALDLVITATTGGQEEAMSWFDRAVRNPEAIFLASVRHTRSVLKNSLILTSPNDTFNAGYRWALLGTDKFRVTTPGMGTSLVAGYSTTRRGWDGGHKVNGRPGYAWYFGRDGQWSGLAMLGYGDTESVRKLLLFYEKYQDLSGKIYHEATTSGVIHYDASDATPLYLVLAGRYFRYSNDTAYLRESWPHIKKALEFCFSTDTDGDHLIENTNVGHGWVEGGALYGSHATLYLNACWAAALKEAYTLAGMMKEPDSLRYMAEHNEIMNIVNRDYWQAAPGMGGPAKEFGFYSYGMNADRTFRKEITILPSVAIYFGLTESHKSLTMLEHYSSNRFSTRWGARIIGDHSPLFKPTGYHYGSVWPLFTGWTALAEYRSGFHTQGFTHIMNNLGIYRNWSLGYVEEVLNGAVYEPSGVCPHQCWSETMVLQPAVEGLLGLDVRAHENSITLAPQVPVNWDSLKAEHIRYGDRTLDFRFDRLDKKCIWTFTPSGGSVRIDFRPLLPAGTITGKAFLDGREIPYTTQNLPDGVVVNFTLFPSAHSRLELETDQGIGVVPMIYAPVPGDSATGFRVLSCRLAGKTYIVNVEGPAGTTGDFYIRGFNTPIRKIVHSDIFLAGPGTYLFRVKLGESEQPYVRKTVTIDY